MCLRSCEVAQGTNMAAGAGLCSLFTTTSAKEPWLLLLRLEQPQLWGRERDPALEEPTFEEAPSQVGGEASSPAIAREKWGSNHSKASSPFFHLLLRHCLYRERFGRI